MKRTKAYWNGYRGFGDRILKKQNPNAESTFGIALSNFPYFSQLDGDAGTLLTCT